MVLLLQPKAQYMDTIGQPQVLTFHMTNDAAAPAQCPVQEHNRPAQGTYIQYDIMCCCSGQRLSARTQQACPRYLHSTCHNGVAAPAKCPVQEHNTLPQVLTFHMTYGAVAAPDQGQVQEHNRPAPGTYIPHGIWFCCSSPRPSTRTQ